MANFQQSKKEDNPTYQTPKIFNDQKMKTIQNIKHQIFSTIKKGRQSKIYIKHQRCSTIKKMKTIQNIKHQRCSTIKKWRQSKISNSKDFQRSKNEDNPKYQTPKIFNNQKMKTIQNIKHQRFSTIKKWRQSKISNTKDFQRSKNEDNPKYKTQYRQLIDQGSIAEGTRLPVMMTWSWRSSSTHIATEFEQPLLLKWYFSLKSYPQCTRKPSSNHQFQAM